MDLQNISNMSVKRSTRRSPQQTHPNIILASVLKLSYPNWMSAMSINRNTKMISVATVTIFDSLFLNGLLMKMNNPIKTEVNIKMGSANIGYLVNTPIIRQ